MKCHFFKSDGLRCDANAMKQSEYCFTHNPETHEAVREAAQKGGSAPRRNDLDLPPVNIKSVQDLVLLLEDTVNKVRDGTLPIRTANCVGYLSGIILKALQSSELEKRIEAVESILHERDRYE